MSKLSKSLLHKRYPAIGEEEKLQSVINTLNGNEEYTLDVTGTIISTNLESVSITGYDEWELIGKSFSVVYPDEEVIIGKPEQDLLAANQQGAVYFPGLKKKKKGNPFWAKTKIQALYEEGECSGYKVVIQDATHQTMYSIGVRSLKEEYTQLFNNPYFGIFKFHYSNGNVIALNAKAKELFSSIKEVTIESLFALENEKNIFLKTLNSKNKISDFEFRFSSKEEKYYSISCKHFKNLDTLEGVIQDITNQRKALASVQNLNHELDTFLYRASHDLRSPLTTILGLTELIRIEESKEEIKEYNNKIKERVSGLDTLLRNLSLVAYNNAVPLSKRLININELTLASYIKLNSKYPSVNCNLENTLEFPLIHSDPERLSIILDNLLENAFKFSAAFQTSPEVSLKFEIIDQYYFLYVSDNGPGISPENLNDIFKLFFKAALSNNGSGLGLYLVKSIAEKLGGDVDVESKLGAGTTFIVKIPI